MGQRSKNIALIVGFIMMSVVSYKLSFSETFESYKNVKELRVQAERSITIGDRLTSLQSQEKYLDSILNANQIKNTSVQNGLLDLLNSQSQTNSLKIAAFNQPHVFNNELAKITSYSFILNGSFNEILSVIYSLEQDYSFGKVVHLNFEKKRDYRKNRNYLECLVILEESDMR